MDRILVVLAIPVVIVAVGASLLKFIRATSLQAASAGIGILLFGISIALTVPFVGGVLATAIGPGTVFLIMELAFLFGGYFQKVAFVPAGRIRGQSSWRQLDTWMVLLFAFAICALFLAVDAQALSGPALKANSEPTAAAIILLARLHSMGVAMLMVRQAIVLTRARWFGRLGRIGARTVMVGYSLALAIGVLRIVGGSMDSSIVRTVFHYEVIPARISALLIVLGHLFIFVRHRPPSWSPSEVGPDYTLEESEAPRAIAADSNARA